ncbi:hypothetical protein DFR29_11039 [Tahibacter aquaticus]|uniref:Uncharacterized protein n=1 Tax=Tahibacter aquaticus TaxID=520092 RepID=A0A4R6YT45_9GAMM|nr:hypothetical protein [Tahibacter aquaticus]TDR41557.1 hypothetical protein DFR29_11039 [Tahibacter aquaticus]
MRDIIVRTFADGRLLDELIAAAAAVQIARTGEARYDLCVIVNAQQRLALRLWGSRKGAIETRLECAGAADAAMPALAHFAADGCLISLQLQDCALHLEHLSRGHYGLGLQIADVAWQLDFLSRGYIQCELVSPIAAPAGEGR